MKRWITFVPLLLAAMGRLQADPEQCAEKTRPAAKARSLGDVWIAWQTRAVEAARGRVAEIPSPEATATSGDSDDALPNDAGDPALSGSGGSETYQGCQ